MTAVPQATDLAAAWREARLLYPLYTALAREFVIEVPSCADLEAGVEAPPKESVEQAQEWFRVVDERIQVHQLRQFLQTTSMASQESLLVLLSHHLHKGERSAADRDKVDFLLVQYFSHTVPSGVEESDVDLEYVAQVLEPALGEVDLAVPDWLQPLEQVIQSARNCGSLSELLHSGILEQGRKLKMQCGDKYFVPAAMVAFTRFSFLMRRVFFHLMHEDLNAILDGLRELEHRGVSTLDCRRAQFSAEEPISRLRMICQSWRVMFHAEYSSGQPLRMLVDFRAAVDDALAASAEPDTKTVPAKKAMAASAAAGGGRSSANHELSVNSSTVPEFDVSAGSASWGPDLSGKSSDDLGGAKDE
jgi:hypothetical protein